MTTTATTTLTSNLESLPKSSASITTKTPMNTSKIFSIGQHRRVDSLPRSFQISRPKVSLKHSLDIASPSLSSSSSKTKRSILVGSRYRDQSRSSSTRRQIFANEPIRNKDGSITLSSAFGSVPAIRLEVCCPTFFFFWIKPFVWCEFVLFQYILGRRWWWGLWRSFGT